MSKTKSVAKKATTNETAIVTAVEVTNNDSALTAPLANFPSSNVGA